MNDIDTSVSTLSGPRETDGPRLRGNLGALGLFFSVLAYNAPLVVVIGVIPVMLELGNGIATPVVFIVAGLILAAFAAGFLRMSEVLPRPGAFYAYVTAGLGKKVGLGSGFTTLVGYFCVCAGTFSFGGVVLGSLVATTFHGPDLPWYVWGFAFWVVAALLGYLRVDLSAKITAVLLFCELIVVFIYDLVIFARGGADGLSAAPFSPGNWFDGSFSIGLLLAIGMFGGYEVTVLFRDEVRNPKKTIPRATYGVIVSAIVIYATTSWLFVNALGVDGAVSIVSAGHTEAMDSTIVTFGGHFLLDAATVLVNTSTFAVILCAHNICARYLFNMSADGIFPRSLSGVHARHGSPHVASFVVSAACLLLNVAVAALGIDAIAFYAAMLGVAALTVGLVQLLTCIAVPIYLTRTGNHRGSMMRSIILPVIAAVGLGVTMVLGVLNFPILTGGSETVSNILLLLIAGLFVLGFVLAIFYSRSRPEVYKRIGRQ